MKVVRDLKEAWEALGLYALRIGCDESNARDLITDLLLILHQDKETDLFEELTQAVGNFDSETDYKVHLLSLLR